MDTYYSVMWVRMFCDFSVGPNMRMRMDALTFDSRAANPARYTYELFEHR